MKVIYRASDGKEFENEDDCRDYETEQLKELFNKSIYLFNKGEEIDLESTSNFVVDVNAAWYAYVTKDVSEYTDIIAEIYGYCFPTQKGYYMWDDDCAVWKSLDEHIKEIEEELEHYELIKTLLTRRAENDRESKVQD